MLSMAFGTKYFDSQLWRSFVLHKQFILSRATSTRCKFVPIRLQRKMRHFSMLSLLMAILNNVSQLSLYGGQWMKATTTTNATTSFSWLCPTSWEFLGRVWYDVFTRKALNAPTMLTKLTTREETNTSKSNIEWMQFYFKVSGIPF